MAKETNGDKSSKVKESSKAKESDEGKVIVRKSYDPLIVALSIIVVILAVVLVLFGCPSCEPTGAVVTGANNTNTGTTPTETGKLTILEFSEFQCPYCGAAAGLNDAVINSLKTSDPTWEPAVPKIKEEYGDKVNVVFKHFIVHGESAKTASEASECARDQGKFWEYHDILFKNQNALGEDQLKQYAADLGLDTAKFNSCLDSGEKGSLVDADTAEGRNLGVTGTPTFFVGDFKVVGAQSYSRIKSVIEQALTGKKPEPQPTLGNRLVSFDTYENVEICREDGKPIIYLFTTTWCSHCRWIKETFDSVAKGFVEQGKIVAHHWQVDTGDDTLTEAVETELPEADRAVYEKFNPRGSVPTFVFGCKYTRVGNAYERVDDLEAEENDFREVIRVLLRE